MASSKLREALVKAYLKYLVQEPLISLSGSTNCYVPREESYVNLCVLMASDFEQEITNSDREILLQQTYMQKEGIKMSELLNVEDEIVVVRGGAGCGKTSLVEMFAMKWAQGKLNLSCEFDFIFTFTCREINTFLKDISSVDDLFQRKYPDVFETISLRDLKNVADRVLIIIDGVDELKDIIR